MQGSPACTRIVATANLLQMPTAVPARPATSRLFVSSAIALLAVLSLCGATAAGYTSATGWVEHTLRVQHALDTWTNALVEIQNESRGFIATNNPAFLRDRSELLATERAELKALRVLMADNPSQLRALAQANQDAEAVLEHLQHQLNLVEAGGQTQAVERLARAEGKQLMDRFRAAVAKMSTEENRLLD